MRIAPTVHRHLLRPPHSASPALLACTPHLTCHPAQVFVKAPMVLELSVKDTLEPRAAFLRKTLRLPADALGKLIVRHPQVRLL